MINVGKLSIRNQFLHFYNEVKLRNTFYSKMSAIDYLSLFLCIKNQN